MGILAGTGFIGSTPLDKWISSHLNLTADEMATDEEFWAGIRGGYRLKPDYINLENGYYCFQPQEVLEKFISHIREVNYQGSWYMRTVQWENKKNIAADLARVAGCSAEELIITRNTTESLDMVIGGLDWKAGDEAVFSHQDYGAMQDMFRQVSERYGVINRIITIPNHPDSDEQIVGIYEKAITANTRLLMIPHIVNITGQIMPVKKICTMAREKSVPVLVDGAHAFAHFQYRIDDLGCDFYGTSLHKWLSVPLGAGFLYVRKKAIGKVWPLIAESELPKDDIYRLNHTGTHPVHTDLAIRDALEFYHKLGPERKEARLRYLQQYWTSRVRGKGKVEINTPADSHRSCGIANVGIRGMDPGLLAETLFKKYNIYTVAIDRPPVQGCRITPNVYTLRKELDNLVAALLEMGSS